MKNILISIKPKYVSMILNGNKTIEVRKRFPVDYVGWVYIYCTKDKKYANLINRGGFLTGMVVARFWCDNVEEYINGINCDRLEQGNYQDYINDKVLESSCVSDEDLFAYAMDLHFFAIHITKLEIFDKPKEISEFSVKVFPHRKDNLMTRYLTRAPQSWQFIEV